MSGKKVFIQIYKKIRYRFTKPERDMLRKGERLYKVDIMCIYFKISSSQLGQCFSLQIIDWLWKQFWFSQLGRCLRGRDSGSSLVSNAKKKKKKIICLKMSAVPIEVGNPVLNEEVHWPLNPPSCLVWNCVCCWSYIVLIYRHTCKGGWNWLISLVCDVSKASEIKSVWDIGIQLHSPLCEWLLTPFHY